MSQLPGGGQAAYAWVRALPGDEPTNSMSCSLQGERGCQLGDTLLGLHIAAQAFRQGDVIASCGGA